MLFLADVRDRLTVISLDEQDDAAMLDGAAAVHLSGGAVYDAILGYCA